MALVLACAPPNNQRPRATVQVDDVIVGEQVVLDARNSTDPDGHVLTARWTVADPTGQVLDLPQRPRVTFLADAIGTWEVELVVDDGWLSDTLTDAFLVQNTLPEATTLVWIGDQPTQVEETGMFVSMFEAPPMQLEVIQIFDADGHDCDYHWEASWPLADGESESAILDVPIDGPGAWDADLVVSDGWETTTLSFELRSTGL